MKYRAFNFRKKERIQITHLYCKKTDDNVLFVSENKSGKGADKSMLTEKRRGVHPRLTLTPELRSDFLARVEASPELREKKEAFLAEQLDRAEELLGKEFVQFEGLINIYPACGQLGDISGVFGDLYLLGRCDERHLQKVKDAALYYSGYRLWCEPGILDRSPAWHSDLQTTIMLHSMATIYDQFYYEFTDEERGIIRDAMIHKGILPLLDDWVRAGTRIHALDSMGHNWWAVCIANAIIGLCAVYDEMDGSIPLIEEAMGALRAFLEYKGNPALGKTVNFDESGMFWEGALYFNYGMGELAHSLAVLENSFDDGGYLTGHPVWKKIPEAFLSMAYPTSKSDRPYLFTDFGDSYAGMDLHSPMARSMLEAGMGDENFKRYFNTAYGEPSFMDMKWPGMFEWDGRAPELPQVFLSEGAGMCTVRTSGEKDANMLSVRCGFSWNHAHADAGTFSLFHGGHLVICDCGYGRGVNPGFCISSEAHNMILVNGNGMHGWNMSRGCRLPGKIRELVRDGDSLCFIADSTGPRSKDCFRNLRTFIKVDDSLFVIVDDITAYEESAYDFLLHYNGEVEFEGNRMTIKAGDTRTYVDTMVPFDIRREKKDTSGFRYVSTRCGEKSRKLQMMTVISFEDSVTSCDLISTPLTLGCVINKDGVIHKVFYNRVADGQRTHENSVNDEIEGYSTDSYIFADLFGGERKLCVLASFLRKDGRSYLDEWVKTTRFISGRAE